MTKSAARTPRQKKLLMFLSEANPIWEQIFKLEQQLPNGVRINDLLKEKPFVGDLDPYKPEIDAEKQRKPGPRKHHLGVTHSTIRNWSLNNSDIQATKDIEALRHLQHVMQIMSEAFIDSKNKETSLEIKEMVAQYAAQLNSNDVNLYVCANYIGMNASQTQKAIDTIIYNETPLLALAYYPSGKAEEYLNEFGGIYYLWMRREGFNNEIFWMQCALEVRYVITEVGQDVIRTKLLVPDLSRLVSRDYNPGTSNAFWHYDGFLKIVSPKAYWVFEKRNIVRQDFMFFVSNINNEIIDDYLVYRGEYLTSAQDINQSTVSNKIVIRKINREEGEKESAESHRRNMALMPKKLKPGDAEYKFLEQNGF